MNEQSAFDPARYLTTVNGRDYLEVKWRLVWLRTSHPDAQIETELVAHRDQMAIFRARVSIPNAGSATGWGSESEDDFGDYLEKAETKALGRALAALGYGTQFCPDYDFGADRDKVVDAPVQFRNRHASRTDQDGVRAEATQKQINYLHRLAQDAGLSDEALDERSLSRFGRVVTELNRRDYSGLIEAIQAEQALATSAT